MGGFINSQADNEICEALNKRFSDEVDPDDDDGLTYLEHCETTSDTGKTFSTTITSSTACFIAWQLPLPASVSPRTKGVGIVGYFSFAKTFLQP
jgi:hypothetical protein